MRYEFVFMDADETLLDFAQSERAAFAKTFRQYGLTPDEKTFARYREINHGLWASFERGEISKQDILEHRFRDLFCELGLTGAFEGFEDAYQTALGEGSFQIDGAEEVCRRLCRSCRLYLVTNGVASTQRRRMRESGLERYFLEMFISEEIGFQKPQQEFFGRAFAAIPDFDRSRALIVGDSLTSDIAGGRNAGIDTCWFCRHGKPENAGGQADYIIDDLRELYLIVGDERLGNKNGGRN